MMTRRKKLPKGWRWGSLDSVCDSVGGGTPSRKNKAFYKGDIPWLTVKDLCEDQFEVSDATEHITQEAITKSSTHLIPPNNVIVATRVGLGRVAINTKPVAINQDLRALQPKDDLLPEFLLFAILDTFFNIMKFKQGTTVKGIQKIDFLSTMIPLPPLAEQGRIVEVLRQADAIRRKRTEARRLVDEILPALFLDMFGDPATNPKNWPVEPIGALVAFEAAQVRPEANTDYQYLAPEHIESGTGRFTGPHPTPGGGLRSAKNRFSEEHVLYCKLRPYLNKVVLPESSGICSSELIPIRPLGNVSREFLAIYLRLPHFVDSAIRKSQGTKMPRFGPSQMARENMIVPPVRLQHAFCEIANQVFASINKSIDSEATGSALFSVLLSRAFTGELTAK